MLHKNKKSYDYIAIFVSFAIHVFLFIVAHFWTLQPGAPPTTNTYKISLDLQSFHHALANERLAQQKEKEALATSELQASKPPSVSATEEVSLATIHDKNNFASQSVDEHVAEEADEIKRPIEIAEKVPVPPPVDQRGLYKPTENKATGASLEMVGWTWDFLPNAKDDTAEIGKIIFEITIDDFGEVIAIKTLEKTVSPLVEKIYKDEVANLTFSKTNKHLAFANSYTGKITFTLQYK
jgi:protein TonB